MKKRKVILSIIGVAVLGLGATVATYATRNASTVMDKQTGESVLQTNMLTLQLENQSNQNQEVYLNEPIHLRYKITNGTESENSQYDCFSRIVLHKTWGFEGSALELKVVGDNQSNWEVVDPMAGIDEAVKEKLQLEEDCLYLYYKPLLEIGESAVCDLDVVVRGSYITDYTKDDSVFFEASAQSIQAFGAEQAIPSEWGVYAKLDETGRNILMVSQEPFSN